MTGKPEITKTPAKGRGHCNCSAQLMAEGFAASA
jgi:hypothetical protein